VRIYSKAHSPLVSGTTKKTKMVPHIAITPITNPSLAPKFNPGVRMRYGTMRIKTNRIRISTHVQKLMTVESQPEIYLGQLIVTHTFSSFDYHRLQMRTNLIVRP